MKNIAAIICALTISACTSTQVAKFSGSPGCQTKSSTANGQPISTDFCIRKVTFRPSQYLVKVNEQTVFEGTDFTRVAFEKQIQEGKISGGCDANISIYDPKTKHPATFASLPEELTSGCHILAESNGLTLPFKKDKACDEVFYKHLKPILGKVLPTEISRQCVVRLNTEVIFDGTFRF